MRVLIIHHREPVVTRMISELKSLSMPKLIITGIVALPHGYVNLSGTGIPSARFLDMIRKAEVIFLGDILPAGETGSILLSKFNADTTVDVPNKWIIGISDKNQPYLEYRVHDLWNLFEHPIVKKIFNL